MVERQIDKLIQIWQGKSILINHNNVFGFCSKLIYDQICKGIQIQLLQIFYNEGLLHVNYMYI